MQNTTSQSRRQSAVSFGLGDEDESSIDSTFYKNDTRTNHQNSDELPGVYAAEELDDEPMTGDIERMLVNHKNMEETSVSENSEGNFFIFPPHIGKQENTQTSQIDNVQFSEKMDISRENSPNRVILNGDKEDVYEGIVNSIEERFEKDSVSIFSDIDTNSEDSVSIAESVDSDQELSSEDEEILHNLLNATEDIDSQENHANISSNIEKGNIIERMDISEEFTADPEEESIPEKSSMNVNISGVNLNDLPAVNSSDELTSISMTSKLTDMRTPVNIPQGILRDEEMEISLRIPSNIPEAGLENETVLRISASSREKLMPSPEYFSEGENSIDFEENVEKFDESSDTDSESLLAKFIESEKKDAGATNDEEDEVCNFTTVDCPLPSSSASSDDEEEDNYVENVEDFERFGRPFVYDDDREKFTVNDKREENYDKSSSTTTTMSIMASTVASVGGDELSSREKKNETEDGKLEEDSTTKSIADSLISEDDEELAAIENRNNVMNLEIPDNFNAADISRAIRGQTSTPCIPIARKRKIDEVEDVQQDQLTKAPRLTERIENKMREVVSDASARVLKPISINDPISPENILNLNAHKASTVLMKFDDTRTIQEENTVVTKESHVEPMEISNFHEGPVDDSDSDVEDLPRRQRTRMSSRIFNIGDSPNSPRPSRPSLMKRFQKRFFLKRPKNVPPDPLSEPADNWRKSAEKSMGSTATAFKLSNAPRKSIAEIFTRINCKDSMIRDSSDEENDPHFQKSCSQSKKKRRLYFHGGSPNGAVLLPDNNFEGELSRDGSETPMAKEQQSLFNSEALKAHKEVVKANASVEKSKIFPVPCPELKFLLGSDTSFIKSADPNDTSGFNEKSSLSVSMNSEDNNVDLKETFGAEISVLDDEIRVTLNEDENVEEENFDKVTKEVEGEKVMMERGVCKEEIVTGSVGDEQNCENSIPITENSPIKLGRQVEVEQLQTDECQEQVTCSTPEISLTLTEASSDISDIVKESTQNPQKYENQPDDEKKAKTSTFLSENNPCTSADNDETNEQVLRSLEENSADEEKLNNNETTDSTLGVRERAEISEPWPSKIPASELKPLTNFKFSQLKASVLKRHIAEWGLQIVIKWLEDSELQDVVGEAAMDQSLENKIELQQSEITKQPDPTGESSVANLNSEKLVEYSNSSSESSDNEVVHKSANTDVDLKRDEKPFNDEKIDDVEKINDLEVLGDDRGDEDELIFDSAEEVEEEAIFDSGDEVEEKAMYDSGEEVAEKASVNSLEFKKPEKTEIIDSDEDDKLNPRYSLPSSEEDSSSSSSEDDSRSEPANPFVDEESSRFSYQSYDESVDSTSKPTSSRISEDSDYQSLDGGVTSNGRSLHRYALKIVKPRTKLPKPRVRKPKAKDSDDEEDHEEPPQVDKVNKPEDLFSMLLKSSGNNPMGRKRQEQARETYKAMKTLVDELAVRPKKEDKMEDPEGFRPEITLHPHQQHALAWMVWRENCSTSGGILADDMGLGKTIETIALILELKNEDEEVRQKLAEKFKKNKVGKRPGGTLIICPASVTNQWEAEVTTKTKKRTLSVFKYHHAKEDRVHVLVDFDIVITTYDILKNNLNEYGVFSKIHWRRVVLDEGHKIRNANTHISRAVIKLSADKRWVLTGTPINNSKSDLFPIFRFLKLQAFDQSRKYNLWINNDNELGAARLNRILDAVMLRRTKESYQAENPGSKMLSDKTVLLHKIPLSQAERSVYDRMMDDSKQQLLVRLNNCNVPQHLLAQRGIVSHSYILTRIVRLRQICVHPCLIWKTLDPAMIHDIQADLNAQANNADNDDELHPAQPIFNMATKSSKLTAVLDKVREILATGDKLIIVSEFVQVLEVISWHLDHMQNGEHGFYTGKLSMNARDKIIERFNGKDDFKILLLSLTAGGQGLNLMAANHVIIVDVHWNPQLEIQAQDRVYRIGQMKNVFIHKFISSDTIEERIVGLQEMKLEIAKAALEGNAGANKLGDDELRFLFDVPK